MNLRQSLLRLRPAAFSPAAVVFCLLAFITAPSAFAALGSAVYTLDPVPYFNTHPNGPDHRWVLSLVDGKLQVTLPADTPPEGFYNFLVSPTTTLVGGQQYTAVLTFRTVTPTTYPSYFYMFARPAVGGTTDYDIWRQWLGEAGETARTITFPLDLAAYTAGNWRLHVGMKGPGSFIIDSFVIYNGTTKDTQPAVANVTPVSTLPAGVTAATGYAASTITPPNAAAPVTLSLANYTFVAGSTAASATNATEFQRALNDARTLNATTLLIPPGTYYFSGIRTMVLNDVDDLVIDGQGAVLVFRQINNDGQAIQMQNCSRVVVKNLVLDWDWSVKPIASLGTVSNLSADKKQCDFTFADLDATQTNLVRTTAWTKIFEMDATKLVRTGATIYGVPSGTTIAAGPAANVLRATFTSAAPLENGKSYCIRHLYYDMGGFKVLDSNHLTFDAVTIRSMPGMGWQFNGAMHHWQLVNCVIDRAPGARTPLTTAADGVHVTESQGHLVIKGCVFRGSGDDSINIHDNCYQGVAVTYPGDATRLTLLKCKSYQLRIQPGDTLRFHDPDFTELGGSSAPVTRQVATVAHTDSTTQQLTITFTAALPAGLSPNVIVRNTRFASADVRIAGCQFLQTNGHGILFSGEDATIEACYFRNVYITPIQLEANIVQPLWAEGRGVSNVLIRNNTFDANNQLVESDGAAIWAGPSLPWGPTAAHLFDTITIEDNRFFNNPGPIVSLHNAANVVVRHNRTDYTQAIPKATRHSNAILVTASDGLALGGNTWVNTVASPHAYGVVRDSADVTNWSAGTNAVLDLASAATDTFQTYAVGTSFTTGQTLGAAGSGWASGWRTGGSFATPTGVIANTSPLDSGNRLGATVVTQAGKTSANGAVTRAYAAAGLAQPFIINFIFRPDTTPADVRYLLADTRTRAAGPDITASWQIASVNGTWQAFDGVANGGPGAYVDTGVAVVAGRAYDFTVTVNPVAKTWLVNIAAAGASVTKTGLNARSNTFATDTAEAVGGRWLNFAVQELVTGPATVGKTGAFSLDGLVIELP